MFGVFKRLKQQQDAVAREIARLLEEDRQRWSAMSADELLALSDDELVAAARTLAEERVTQLGDFDGAIAHLPAVQRVSYVVGTYLLEVCNGGVLRYLSDSVALTASQLHTALMEIGADAHLELWEAFWQESGCAQAVPLTTRRAVKRALGAAGLRRMDAFDRAFATLEPLTTPLAAYIRKQIGAGESIADAPMQ